MRDDDKKSKRQLVSELEALRGRVAELEAAGSVGELHERTAELARASEQLTMFRRFAEASGQGFSMADLDGRLIYLNPALCRMLGDDGPEGRLGQHLSVCYPEEGNRRGREEIEPALEQNGYWEGELPLLSRQGQHVPTWQNSFVIRDDRGNPLRLAVVITDITERKAAEEALRQSHDELRAIYDGMVDGLHILNLATMRAVRANPALCRMMGYSEEELAVLSPADVHPPEALPWILESFQAYLDGRGSGAAEVPLVRKDGSVFYADISGSRIVYNGEPCVMCFFHDTTQRRRALEALRRERRTLKHMLRASDHERQLIAYDIHDGLAQQLAGALMQFQTYDQLKASRPEEAQKAYDGAVTLLRHGHAEARRLISGVRPPILDESGVIAAIAHLVHDPVFNHGPKIDFRSRVTFHRLAPVVENVIYRIVQEALANARNHSNSNRILVSLVQRDDRLWIEVRDWGVGFDVKKVQKDRFGLAGIRERARLLGGKCRVKSRPGEGSSIMVELPVVEREPA
ncbi:MAG: PAS domain S-box protein [Rhodopirellula sp.]|nr:PAS domain S-box protein [Rhodopirellula sp.]